MKPEAKILADRFREVILNGTWIANTNFRAQLDDIDWQIATKKINDLNTISLLCQHIHYYIRGIRDVLKGGALTISDKFSFDFPPITSNQEWEIFLEAFYSDSEEFAAEVENLNDDQLKNNFLDPKYGSLQRNIDAMIEHCYYHLGQVVLLRKIFEDHY